MFHILLRRGSLPTEHRHQNPHKWETKSWVFNTFFLDRDWRTLDYGVHSVPLSCIEPNTLITLIKETRDRRATSCGEVKQNVSTRNGRSVSFRCARIRSCIFFARWSSATCAIEWVAHTNEGKLRGTRLKLSFFFVWQMWSEKFGDFKKIQNNFGK